MLFRQQATNLSFLVVPLVPEFFQKMQANSLTIGRSILCYLQAYSDLNINFFYESHYATLYGLQKMYKIQLLKRESIKREVVNIIKKLDLKVKIQQIVLFCWPRSNGFSIARSPLFKQRDGYKKRTSSTMLIISRSWLRACDQYYIFEDKHGNNDGGHYFTIEEFFFFFW